MDKSEQVLIDWLRSTSHFDPARVPIGIGDDMAGVRIGGRLVFITADMLLDGVHFETQRHPLDMIGRKSIACSLSDCAAMACRPVAAVVSLALPNEMSMDQAQRLFEGMRHLAAEFDCPIVGGDITSWDQPLAVDVAMLAEAAGPRGPVLRSGAKPGDRIWVTGTLGGSLLGRHLRFQPRVHEAQRLAELLGDRLHAMIDLSDGLAIDLFRICRASGVGAELETEQLEALLDPEAIRAAELDGRPPIEHALHDGEDFELLFCAEAEAPEARLMKLAQPIGRVVASGLYLRDRTGRSEPISPSGYEHFA